MGGEVVTQGVYGIPVLGDFLDLPKVMADLIWCWWQSQSGWEVQPMTSRGLLQRAFLGRWSSRYFAASCLSLPGSKRKLSDLDIYM